VKSHIFKVVIEEDSFENGVRAYHAYCPALRGCHTWGHTPEEALTNIGEAVELYVEDLTRISHDRYSKKPFLLA
jgi:predicted RNase H-like HicB family nuclease